MRSRSPRVIRFAVALALASGGSLSGAAEPGLEGTEWIAVELGGARVAQLSDGRQPSLKLDAAQRKATGHSGCNSFFGSYTLAGPSLRFGPIGATRMACAEPASGAEVALLRALDATRGWKIDGGVLVLSGGDAVLARFQVAPPAGARPDPGSLAYRVTSVSTGPVTLVEGAYHSPAAPGATSEISVRLAGQQAFGSIGGKEVGAVILVASTGGSGIFYDLALLVRSERGWENADTVALGDRVRVQSVAVERGRVSVAMTVHGPQDPSCCPTRQVRRSYSVAGGRLVAEAE